MTDSHKNPCSEEILQRAHRFDAIYNRSLFIVYVIDLDGHIIEVNDAALSLTGYSRDEITGKHIIDFPASAEETQRIISNFNKTVNKEAENLNFEYLMKRKDGSLFWLEVESSILYKDNKPYAVMGIGHDITKRKIAENREKHLLEVLGAIRDINQLIVRERNETKLINEACDILCTVSQFSAVWITLLDKDLNTKQYSFSGDLEGFEDLVYKVNGETLPFCLKSVLKSKDVFVLDLTKSEECKRCVLKCDKLNRTLMMVSIREQNSVAGILGLLMAEKIEGTEEESNLLLEVSDDIGFGLSRIELEKSIQISREQLSRGLEASGMALWDWNLADNTVQWSPQIERFTAKTAETINGSIENYFQFVTEKFRDKVRSQADLFIEAKDTSAEFINEHMLIKGKNERVWVEARGKLIADEEGIVRSFTGLIADVTERKRFEKEIFEQKQFTSRVLNLSPNLTFISDLKTQSIVYINDAVRDILGYTTDTVANMGSSVLSSIVHPEDLPKIGIIQEALFRAAEDKTYCKEIRVKNANGQWLWFKNYAIPFKRDDNGKVRQVLETAINITDLKLSEQRLKSSEEDLRITLKSIGDGVISTDKNGAIVRMNREAERLTSWASEEAEGKDISSILNLINSETGQKIVNPVKEVLSTGEVYGLENHTLLISRDGKRYHISDSAAPVTNETGTVKGVVFTFSDITEKYLLQQQVIESKNSLELAIDGAELGIYSLDIKNGALQFNERFARITKTPPENLPANLEGIKNLIHPEDQEMVFKLLYKHLEGKSERYQAEHRVLSSKGEVVWVLSKGKIVKYDTNGEPLRLLGLVLDITERKQAHEQLALSEERYRTFMQQTSDGIFRLEFKPPFETSLSPEIQTDLLYNNATIEEANDSLAQMYGYKTGEELRGLSLFKLFGNKDYPVNREVMYRFIKNGYKISDAVTSEFDRHGNQHYFTNNMFAIVNGSCLVRAWGTQRDVTDVKKAQEKERIQMQQIVKQKEFIQRIFDLNPNILFIFDFEKQITVYQNDKIEKILGYGTEQFNEMLSKHMSALIHPEDLPDILKHFEILRNAPDGMIVKVEYRIRDVKGNWRFLLSQDTPFARRDNGTVYQAIGTATEITELKNAQAASLQYQEKLKHVNKQLSETNKRLTDIDKMKTEFVSMASHELRTPITSVLGFAQTLLSPDIALEEDLQNQYLQIIEKEARRLGKLAADLLDVSKIESGESELKQETISLEKLALDVIHSINVPHDKKVTLSSDEEGRTPFPCDSDKVRRVFVNLIENALRYGTLVQVEIRGIQDGREVRVRDNGPGIAAEHIDKIFEKFYRIKEEQKPGEGSGLGLSISKDIIETHGGQIRVESQVGHGSTFVFTLKSLK
ncbi:diguanylate cyclase/phosphodiesterase (GGDEF & EAL domains) with PAS/PAC sensor(s) [Chitinispirillum alkaliphilum]|nr:diguanylate cyclase/phosphodiesterase (GGDEF & EAL domains) with PAS/PAC sensor(s) [Chitinispirillum alkaliphilum]